MPEDNELAEVNHTELVQLARAINADVHRGTPREVLEQIVTAAPGEEPEVPPFDVNKYRLRIMEYVNRSWDRVGAFVTCPAMSRDPYQCFGCTDIQVAECFALNPQILKE